MPKDTNARYFQNEAPEFTDARIRFACAIRASDSVAAIAIAGEFLANISPARFSALLREIFIEEVGHAGIHCICAFDRLLTRIREYANHRDILTAIYALCALRKSQNLFFYRTCIRQQNRANLKRSWRVQMLQNIALAIRANTNCGRLIERERIYIKFLKYANFFGAMVCTCQYSDIPINTIALSPICPEMLANGSRIAEDGWLFLYLTVVHRVCLDWVKLINESGFYCEARQRELRAYVSMLYVCAHFGMDISRFCEDCEISVDDVPPRNSVPKSDFDALRRRIIWEFPAPSGEYAAIIPREFAEGSTASPEFAKLDKRSATQYFTHHRTLAAAHSSRWLLNEFSARKCTEIALPRWEDEIIRAESETFAPIAFLSLSKCRVQQTRFAYFAKDKFTPQIVLIRGPIDAAEMLQVLSATVVRRSLTSSSPRFLPAEAAKMRCDLFLDSRNASRMKCANQEAYFIISLDISCGECLRKVDNIVTCNGFDGNILDLQRTQLVRRLHPKEDTFARRQLMREYCISFIIGQILTKEYFIQSAWNPRLRNSMETYSLHCGGEMYLASEHRDNVCAKLLRMIRDYPADAADYLKPQMKILAMIFEHYAPYDSRVSACDIALMRERIAFILRMVGAI
ncbi:MAG: hypothetical protein M0R33_17310 [Methylomonas sp.]|jgi:hypothetical protein|uniref:hypothetical protein n=1 Tax=Methylomonas sp. TaxID=418 RepID=UPI0025D74B9C|nr:hypothetical protein [Methylomonas sp.]MCK9608206.1 hypothetical protein [Methylomonas sp.]